MPRKTEQYPRAWIAHHMMQWGRNWRYVAPRYYPPRKETPMDNRG